MIVVVFYLSSSSSDDGGRIGSHILAGAFVHHHQAMPSAQFFPALVAHQIMQRVHGIYLRPKKSKGNVKGQRHQMPLCKYGAACNRGKSCIYRHEKVPKDSVDTRKVCLAYLADICPYGQRCFMRHPDDEEAESLISMFASQPCRFGTECKQAGCLYFHPEPKSFSADSVNAVEWTPANGLYGNASNSRKQDPTLIPQQWPKIAKDSSIVDGAYADTKISSTLPLESTASSFLDNASTSARRNFTKDEKIAMTKGIKSIQVPLEIWRDHRVRNSKVFLEISNPIQRFGRVNEESAEGCIDLHFLAKYEVADVLDVVLPQYRGERNVWIITGTGHHKEGHQAEGVLFYTTVEYLNRNGYTFKIGVDSRGFRGALHLEKV